jgi:hypothetical protein
MKRPDKITVVDRFAPLRSHLLTLLAGLGEDDWARSTAAPLWSVKDVAAHLLGGDIGILSGKRDGFRLPQNIQTNAQLIELIDRLNAEWVLATRRISPLLLRELLAFTGPQVEATFASLDPMATGVAVGRAPTQHRYGWISPANLLSDGTTSNRFGTPPVARHSTTRAFCRPCWMHSCEPCRTPFAMPWHRQERP